jgi:hypothetical protein
MKLHKSIARDRLPEPQYAEMLIWLRRERGLSVDRQLGS